MIISEKKMDNARYEISVEIPPERVEVEYKMVFDKLVKNVKIDGFRKGKAPVNLVETRFKDTADAEVAENIVKSEFWNAVSEKKLMPITEPQFEFNLASRGASFQFKATFDVPPTVELGKYRDISVEEQACNAKDSDIDDEIDSVREKYAEAVIREAGAQAAMDDMVRIKLKRIDNVDPSERSLAEYKDYAIILGKSKDESSLDEGIVGMKVGDEKEIDVNYSKDYYITDLAGKKIKYSVQLTEINEMKLPELNDEFAKKVSYESVDDMKKKTREYIEKYIVEKTRGDAKSKIVEEIVKNSKFDIPESLVLSEMYNLFKRSQQRVGYFNDNFDEFAKLMGIDPEILRAKLHEDALQSVKTTLVLSEIAKKEELKVDEARYKEVVESIAVKNNKSVEEIEELIKKEDTKKKIDYELLIDSAMEFLYNGAKIKKLKPVTLKELINTK